MKNLKTIAIALLVAFGTMNAEAQAKKVDVSKSKITWFAKKMTGQHDGTVKLQDGALVFKGKKLTGGSFTVDMTSIEVNDLKAGQGKERLEGSLKAADFFGTDKYPTGTLIFKTIAAKGNVYTVTADLTLKGITKPVTFDLTVGANSASTKFNIDRTKYGITINSGNFFKDLGDKAIYDEFEVGVNLVF
jgi:polyisoprenoid-binding protein YceI